MHLTQTRRDFLKLCGLGLAATAASLPVTHTLAQTAAAPGRPNIVLMIADDLTYLDIGFTGNREVKTPNLDRFAAQGVQFTHCFTSTAMCAPTRAMLYTGLFPVRSGAYPNHCKVNPGVRSVAHYLKDLGYRVGLMGKTHYAPGEAFPFEKLPGGGDALSPSGVKEFVNRDTSQPYCLVLCSHLPHGPWERGDPSQYDPARLIMPPYLADTPEERKLRAAYFAEITELDRQLGECLAAIDRSAGRDNTFVAFVSEQGSGRNHAKWTCYDLGLRAACVVRWPSRVKPGTKNDAMIQYVDFTPTFIELAGGAPIDGLDGKSFLPALLGQKTEHRDVVYGVHTTRGIIQGSPNYPIRSIRTRTHKYIMNLNHEAPFRNVVTAGPDLDSWRKKAKTDPHVRQLMEAMIHRPAEEFYELNADPLEMHNLAGDPKYRPMMDEMRGRLEAWMKEQGDRGVATELEALKHQAAGSDEGEGGGGGGAKKKAGAGKKNGAKKGKKGGRKKAQGA